MQRTQSLMSTQNLAAFTKQRPFLKVIGTPNLNATASSKSSMQASIFSYKNRRPKSRQDGGRDAVDGKSQRSGVSQNNASRFQKNLAAEQHKKHIYEVVNTLNEEELEKVSEMLKASEARAAQHSDADAASKAAAEADLFDDAAEGAENAEDADGTEIVDGVDEMYVRVDTPEQDVASKANSMISASKQSVVSSLQRQL